MSPTIRDGRGQLEVVDMTPERAGSPPPVAIDRLVPIELALPCDRCLHEPVCAIREAIDRSPIQVRQPAAPHPAIRIVIAATASCDHFLEAPAPTVLEARPAIGPGRLDHALAVARPRPAPGAGQRPATVDRPVTQLRNSRDAGEVVARGKDALAALERHGGNRDAAAAELGYRPNAFAMVIKYARTREERAT